MTSGFMENLAARWPFWVGISARRVLRLYLLLSGLMMFILLMIALTIDMAKYLPDVRLKAENMDQPLAQVLLPYLGYRAVDIVTRLLPMACFLGLFLAEILRAFRLERIILAFAGFSPVKSLPVILLFAILVGSIEAALETRLRPWAVFAQVDLGLGAYGRRFDPQLSENPVWFVIGDTAIRARILRGEAPELRDIEMFRGLDQSRLTSVLVAARATPGGADKTWRFEYVTEWQADADGRRYKMQKTPVREITLELLPEQVRYYNIDSYYLPTKDLNRIATMHDAETASDADTAIWRRWSAFLLPGAFAFLGASLAQVGYRARRASVVPLIFYALVGYLSIVSVKVLWALGELGVLAAPVAVLGSIAGTILVAITLQISQSRARIQWSNLWRNLWVLGKKQASKIPKADPKS